jgi:anti-sigma factor RsiW
MAPEYLTCREMVELVTEYLEGAMPPELRAVFEAHLAVCPGCSAYLQQMRQTVALLGTIPEESVPSEAMGELIAAFRSWRAGQPSSPAGD